MKDQKPCDTWANKLAARHYDDLSASEREALRKHVVSCTACANAQKDYDALTERIRAAVAGEPLPDLSRELSRFREGLTGGSFPSYTTIKSYTQRQHNSGSMNGNGQGKRPARSVGIREPVPSADILLRPSKKGEQPRRDLPSKAIGQSLAWLVIIVILIGAVLLFQRSHTLILSIVKVVGNAIPDFSLFPVVGIVAILVTLLTIVIQIFHYMKKGRTLPSFVPTGILTMIIVLLVLTLFVSHSPSSTTVGSPGTQTPTASGSPTFVEVERQHTGTAQRKVYTLTLGQDEVVVGDAVDFQDRGLNGCVAFRIQGPGKIQFSVKDGQWLLYSGVTNQRQADELLQKEVDYLKRSPNSCTATIVKVHP